jgi:hypothetical protein
MGTRAAPGHVARQKPTSKLYFLVDEDLVVLLHEVEVDCDGLVQEVLGLLHLVPVAPDDPQLHQAANPAYKYCTTILFSFNTFLFFFKNCLNVT